MNLDELDDAIEQKKSELKALEEAKEKIEIALDDVEQILDFPKPAKKPATKTVRRATKTPKATKRKKTPKKKAVNKKSAKSHAIDILKANPKGLSLADLAEEVLKAGFATNSSNFKASLYQTIYGDFKEGRTFQYTDDKKWKLKK